MKEITLKVPDNNFPFFVELVNKLGFEITQKKRFCTYSRNEKYIG